MTCRLHNFVSTRGFLLIRGQKCIQINLTYGRINFSYLGKFASIARSVEFSLYQKIITNIDFVVEFIEKKRLNNFYSKLGNLYEKTN
jgi:hypothetical protein